MIKSILLISSSSTTSGGFLQSSIGEIEKMLCGVKSLCFIPYAAVTISFDDYFDRFRTRLAHLDIEVTSLHTSPSSLDTAEAICVGGGNTFALLHRLQAVGLLSRIRRRVEEGTPYIGWSAGSNIASPTIATTNDMPIVTPCNFEALALVPFQINPHYTDLTIEGHCGESRAQRIEEYTTLNPSDYVVGLPEGAMLRIEGECCRLLGEGSASLFKGKEERRELTQQDDINFLMKQKHI